ncbi:hypothetical protein F4824DRAFT_509864 [Ustulina deusta]|nr:hypothetical protein F4824DRAFT_509864 [Ustulina deusta]
MGQRANTLSRSAGSITPQPLLQDTDHDALFLPTNSHVYLTHTKDGKPALGRKKTGKLLQDFGFDILGQSFGIPSRKDYEGQARPLSTTSQSSGLITAQATPRRSREAYVYDDTESPEACRKANSIHSSSTTPPGAMARCNDKGISNWYQHEAYRANPSFLKPQALNQRHIPPPPPPPPSVVGWNKHATANTGVAPIPMNYYSAAYQPTRLPSYPYNNTAMFQSVPNWANLQHPMPARYPDHLGISVPQGLAMPVLPHHQQFRQTQPTQLPHTQPIPAIHPANIPPPPPPPPQQGWLQAYTMATDPKRKSRQDTKQVGNARAAVKELYRDGSPPREAGQAHEKPKYNEDVRQRLSKRIRHVHVCAGCGKKRSTRYQRAHPLKRGEIPALNYCYSCLKDAADTDCETSDGDGVSGPSYRTQNRKDASVPWPSSDEGHTIADGQYIYEQSRHGPRWVKKSVQFGPLSRLFSRRVASNPFPPPPRSVSSAEESRSRASSPVSDSYATHSVRRTPGSSVRRGYDRANSGTVQSAESAALPRRKRDNADPWSKKHGSPLVPREKEPGKAKNEKIRTTSNDKPALARPRTRIPRPRPRPQSRSIDIDISQPVDVGDLANVLGSSLRLDTSGVTMMTPISQPAGVETFSNPPNRTLPNKTRRTAKQTNTQDATSEGVKKRCPSSSETANYTEVPSDANGLGAQPFVDKSWRTPVAAGSDVVLKETTDKPTDYSNPKSPSIQPHVPDHNPQINLEQTETIYQLHGSEKGRRQRPSDNIQNVAGASKAAFNWDEPLTPMDMPYTGDSHSPRVMSDSWSSYQTDMEREAEEMAERDLAFAGKLFDSLSGSFGGSATSAPPVSSFVTTSNMSIVSYDSDSDHSDGDIATPSITEVEVRECAEVNKPIRRIEFSSEKEQRQKFVKSKLCTELTIAHAEHSSSHMAELSDHQKNNLYNKPEGREDEDDNVDYFPSPVGSSLVGHTGHSTDELVRNSPAQIADGYPLRGFRRLLSA